MNAAVDMLLMQVLRAVLRLIGKVDELVDDELRRRSQS